MRVFGNFGSVLLKIYLNFCVLFLWFAVFFFSVGFKLCFLWGRFDCNDSPEQLACMQTPLIAEISHIQMWAILFALATIKLVFISRYWLLSRVNVAIWIALYSLLPFWLIFGFLRGCYD